MQATSQECKKLLAKLSYCVTPLDKLHHELYLNKP